MFEERWFFLKILRKNRCLVSLLEQVGAVFLSRRDPVRCGSSGF